MEGLILVDKPQNITSHDVVDFVRKRLGIRRVGHGGSLDPLATGLLIILIGKTTKLFSQLSELDKEYEATLKVGISTDTGDIEGRILKEEDYYYLSQEKIEEVFKKFRGEILQVPPMVSALRYKGKRLYELARKGKDVPRKPRKVKIYSLEIRKIYLPFIDFFVHCSKGTYIRKLAHDIGEELGCGACIVRIRRIRVGPFSIKEAVKLEEINESIIRTFSSFPLNK